MKIARRLVVVLLMVLGLGVFIPGKVSKPVAAAPSDEIRIFVRSSRFHTNDWYQVSPTTASRIEFENLVPDFRDQTTEPFIAVAIQRNKPYPLPSASISYGGTAGPFSEAIAEAQYTPSGFHFSGLPGARTAAQSIPLLPNGTSESPSSVTAYYRTRARYVIHNAELGMTITVPGSSTRSSVTTSTLNVLFFVRGRCRGCVPIVKLYNDGV